MKTDLAILSAVRTLMYMAAVLVGASPYAFAFRVCIDPGHGGDRPRCLTLIPNYYEKHANLAVAECLKDSLYYSWLMGNYIFTPLTDTNINLCDRADLANAF